MIEILKSPYKNIFCVSFIVYLVTAYYSIGFYHPDEHFQILEFCNYKLGLSPLADLPWEFNEHIRPALQPTIAAIMIKAFNLFNIHNQFTYALIFRLLCALLSWFVFCKLSLLVIREYLTDIGKRIFVFMSLLLGFVPYISVRFSSENLAAITFLGALYFIIKSGDDNKNTRAFNFIIPGILLGLSFFFRFQMAFAIVGLGLWLIIIKKTQRNYIITLLISGILIMTLCVYIDYWFYGHFELTPLNYFKANVIENKAAYWGVSPWWYYFNEFIHLSFPVFTILLLIFFFIGIFQKRMNIFVWCLVPFLLAHCSAGHKEIRFLFPIVFIFIYLITTGIDFIIKSFKLMKFAKYLYIFIIILNIHPLFAKMFTPSNNDLYFYRFLYEKSPKAPIALISHDKGAFGFCGLKINFYNNPNIIIISNSDEKEFWSYLNTNKSDTVYVFENNYSNVKSYPGYKNECVCSIYPKWVQWSILNKWEADGNNLQMLTKIK